MPMSLVMCIPKRFLLSVRVFPFHTKIGMIFFSPLFSYTIVPRHPLSLKPWHPKGFLICTKAVCITRQGVTIRTCLPLGKGHNKVGWLSGRRPPTRGSCPTPSCCEQGETTSTPRVAPRGSAGEAAEVPGKSSCQAWPRSRTRSISIVHGGQYYLRGLQPLLNKMHLDTKNLYFTLLGKHCIRDIFYVTRKKAAAFTLTLKDLQFRKVTRTLN